MKIKKIEYGGIKDTYDIEVPDYHEYLLENGCVSHNSSAIWSGGTEGIEFPKDFIVQKTFNNIVEKQILPDLNKLGQYYKLAWDIDNKVIIELASIRQIFIDQSQSVSLYYTQEKGKYLSHKHLEDTIYAIKNGLKTLYYSYNKDEDQSKYKHCDSCQ